MVFARAHGSTTQQLGLVLLGLVGLRQAHGIGSMGLGFGSWTFGPWIDVELASTLLGLVKLDSAELKA